MKCRKCGSAEFFIPLQRPVKIYTVGGEILDVLIDDEQFIQTKRGGITVFCAGCSGRSVIVTDGDIDNFWKMYNQRVSRVVRNPRWIMGMKKDAH